MKGFWILLVCLLLAFEATCQNLTQEYYLPGDVEYKSSIPTPASVIGHEVGEWHLSHDKLVHYLQMLSESSDRIQIQEIGKTHENRPLLLLTVTSAQNHQNLESVKNEHLTLSSGAAVDTTLLTKMPAVIWMGYSIHGNEPSGANAAPLLAYYLAAAESPEVDSLLASTVILIDPCLNPDGMQRFSSWVNANKSHHLIGDPTNREHHEPWPKGRTNHYWFDLNRDWIMSTQPESQSRIKVFHDWKPNVVTDFHEMRSNATFFFQPGVPERTHPSISQKNISLTQKITEYNARAFDRQRKLYFTRELFDDFYPGKGSTYPDLNGGVGILYEQASSRGHLRETENGSLSFMATVKNQLTMSLSTLKAVVDLRGELLKYQAAFYQNSMDMARKDTEKAYIFGDANDRRRVNALARLLQSHDITIYRPLKNVDVNKKIFYPESSFVIPLSQPQYQLIKTLFERRKSFVDSAFYDISAWALDLAFDVDFETLTTKNIESDLAGAQVELIDSLPGQLPWKSRYAYAIRWDHYYAPSVLYHLLHKGVMVKVTEKEFHDVNGNRFASGTLVVPMGIQTLSPDDIYDLLEELSELYKIEIFPVETGLTPLGVDIGSPSMHVVKKPEILLLTGEGVNAYEAGEIWHLLDYKLDIPLSLAPLGELANANLSRYTCIIFPDGNYAEIPSAAREKIKAWVHSGGTLVAQNDAISWLKNQGMLYASLKEGELDTARKEVRYADIDKVKGVQNMAGAIFQTKMDITHPICFGYHKNRLPVFKNSRVWVDLPDISFNSPVTFTQTPLLAGFISARNTSLLRNSSAVLVSRAGEGRTVAFAFTPAFRGSWRGTEKLLINSLFFGDIIKTRY